MDRRKSVRLNATAVGNISPPRRKAFGKLGVHLRTGIACVTTHAIVQCLADPAATHELV